MQNMTVIAKTIEKTTEHLRRFNFQRDLQSVADLIESCFAGTMDIDGERYIRQMRNAARNAGLLRWAGSMAEPSILPMAGLVWEEDGKVVGNLTLIQFSIRGQRCNLIANVAVHPDYRRRGIARALTQAGIQQAQDRHVSAVWLQVREENQAAYNLYRSLQFYERFRRSIWHLQPDTSLVTLAKPVPPVSTDIKVISRRGQDWLQQESWLKRIYPPEITWHMPYNKLAFQPGFLGVLYRIFTDCQIRQWSAWKNGELLGIIGWQKYYGQADRAWLATPPTVDPEGLYSLIFTLCQRAYDRRLIILDYPAHQGEEAIRTLGFTISQNLVWMEYPLARP